MSVIRALRLEYCADHKVRFVQPLKSATVEALAPLLAGVRSNAPNTFIRTADTALYSPICLQGTFNLGGGFIALGADRYMPAGNFERAVPYSPERHDEFYGDEREGLGDNFNTIVYTEFAGATLSDRTPDELNEAVLAELNASL